MKTLFITALTALFTATQVHALTNGLVAYYPFNGNATDESGNGRNGTVNSATLTTDRFGNANAAYQFANASIVATNLPLDLSGPYTLSMWIRLNSFQEGAALFELSVGTSCNGNPQMFHTGGNSYYAECGGGLEQFNFFGTEADLTNQWRHLVATVGGGITRVFADGVLISTNTQAWAETELITLTLGAGRGGIQPSMSVLDDVRLYNRILTPLEVSQLHAMESQTNVDNALIVYFPFNGNAVDESGNGKHGNVNGATLTQDRFGQSNSAYEFVNASITASNIPVNLSGGYTFSAWIKLHLFQQGGAIFELSMGAACNGNPQLFQTSGSVFYARCGDAPDVVDLFGTAEDLTNQWRHLVATVNGNSTKIYRDAVLVASSTQGWPATDSIMLTLGAGRGGIQHSTCSIDDVRIYNRAFSDSEVTVLFQSETAVSRVGIIALPTVTIEGQPGVACRIEYKNNVDSPSWTTLTNLILTNSFQIFPDLSATNQPQRFYRVLVD